MHPEARLYVFEIYPSFCEVLTSIPDSRLTVISAGAQDMVDQLAHYDVFPDSVDAIVS